MKIKKRIIEPTYKKDTGAWVLDTQHVLSNDEFFPVEQSIVYVPPKQIAGNHKHERQEALIGIGPDVYFAWQDDDGTVRQEPMNPDGRLYMFVIPGGIAHAVVNRSSTQPAVLYEYFDDVYREVERVAVLAD